LNPRQVIIWLVTS